MRALADGGCDLDALTEPGVPNKLIVAASNGHAEVRPSVHCVFRLVHSCPTSSNLQMVRVLHELGIGTEGVDGSGRTALLRAASRGKTETVRLLCRLGANVEAVTPSDGSRALHAAMKTRSAAAIVELLVTEFGAAADSMDHRGFTPMAVAASKGRVDAFRLLHKHGADAEARDHQGRTPLAQCVMAPLGVRYLNHTLRMLVTEAKVNIAAPDNDGCTPLGACVCLSSTRID